MKPFRDLPSTPEKQEDCLSVVKIDIYLKINPVPLCGLLCRILHVDQKIKPKHVNKELKVIANSLTYVPVILRL